MPPAVIEQHHNPHKYSHHSPQFQRRPSPPPIATLSAPSTPGSETSRPRSTSTSYSRSGGVSSYHPYPPPPASQHYYSHSANPPMYPAEVYPPPQMPFVTHHGQPYTRDPYHHPPPPPQRDPYMHGSHNAYPPTGYPMPGHPPTQIVYTEDAATKLSDRVRRRCFNCCTTDTSTWRRSNLSPGKVLCNKCGLFERTHSRPRPEQFPHKRGPLATSALRSRSPQSLPPPSQHSPHLQNLTSQSSGPPHLPPPHSTSPLISHHNLPPPTHSLPPPRSLSDSPGMISGPHLPPISSNGHEKVKYDSRSSESPRLPNIKAWAAENGTTIGGKALDYPNGNANASTHGGSPLNGQVRSVKSSPHLSPKLPALKNEHEKDIHNDEGK